MLQEATATKKLTDLEEILAKRIIGVFRRKQCALNREEIGFRVHFKKELSVISLEERPIMIDDVLGILVRQVRLFQNEEGHYSTIEDASSSRLGVREKSSPTKGKHRTPPHHLCRRLHRPI